MVTPRVTEIPKPWMRAPFSADAPAGDAGAERHEDPRDVNPGRERAERPAPTSARGHGSFRARP